MREHWKIIHDSSSNRSLFGKLQPLGSCKVGSFSAIKSMTKSNMVGPWKCDHKLTRILYQSTAGQTSSDDDLGGHQCRFLPEHSQRRKVVRIASISMHTDNFLELGSPIPRNGIPRLWRAGVEEVETVQLMVLDMPGEPTEEHPNVDHGRSDPWNVVGHEAGEGAGSARNGLEVPGAA